MIRSRLLREGSVGLFFLLGAILFGGAIFFLKGRNLQTPEYQVKFFFENAGGLKEGAIVYYRGVGVGRVIDIQPSSNGVEISSEIDGSLRIPKDISVSTLRSGLLGQVSINIVPQTDIPDVAAAAKINPLDKRCKEQQLVLCDGHKISGTSYPDVVESLSLIADRINNEQLFEVINDTLLNINETTEKMTALTDEVTIATEKIGKTADTFRTTAKIASGQLENLGNSYSNTGEEINLLVSNLNQLIDDNKASFSNSIANFSDMTAEISRLVNSTDKLLANVNPSDVVKISQNLGTTSENLAGISQDLKNISEELNNPTNLVSIQQTLDSARVTFANAAKITSDIDEFTGDPEFRNNLRKLVDGLGNLVSYTDILEKQVELAKILGEFEQIKAKENKTISIDQNQQLDPNSEVFPTAFSSSNKINLNKNY